MLMYDTVTYKNANLKARVNLVLFIIFQIIEGFEQNRPLFSSYGRHAYYVSANVSL